MEHNGRTPTLHYNVDDVVMHRGHKCIVTGVWEDDGQKGVTIKPYDGYGFEVDVYEETVSEWDAMREMLKMLIEEFNDYSELVALNYAHKKEHRCEEGMLEWNRGSLNKIQEHMEKVAEMMGVKLEYKCESHVFGYDDWRRTLEYRTVKEA